MSPDRWCAMARDVPPPTRLILVEMPFKAASRPSIGLSMLRAASLHAGYRCEIQYANLVFANRIGFRLYEFIADRLPPEALFGDLVFQPLVRKDRPLEPSLVRAAQPARAVEGASVPAWLWRLLPDLQREAGAFLSELADSLLAEGCRWFGVSSMFQVAPNLALARFLKEREESSKIVMGGACCEGEMGLAIHEEFPWIDFVCRGEGEQFIVELLHHLETGQPPASEIPGLVSRVGTSSVAVGESTERIRDLGTLASPDYGDWVARVRDFEDMLPMGDLWLTIEASRGCWWGQRSHCTFCGLNGENMVFRAKDAEQVWDEIMAQIKYGIKKLYFVDLILPQGFFQTFLPRLAEADLGVTAFYEVKSNLSFRQLELLSAAGVRLLQPGIESLSTPILRLMRKGVTGIQNLRLLKWAAELGVDLSWNILYGFPGEDPAEYARMASLVPLISHLQPPVAGCRRVRVDRFSPLFFDRDPLGVGPLRPVPAYEAVYGLPPDRLSRLAYFFEPETASPPEMLSREHQNLTKAVDSWIDGLGESSFSSLRRKVKLLLFDRRPGLDVSDRVLRGLEKAVYVACEEGATFRSLLEITGVAESEIKSIINDFLYEHIIVNLDDYYLALAVRMDRWVRAEIPEPLLGPVCHAIWRARMSELKRPGFEQTYVGHLGEGSRPEVAGLVTERTGFLSRVETDPCGLHARSRV